MDTKKPYQHIENNLQNIDRENSAMNPSLDFQPPPPPYNGAHVPKTPNTAQPTVVTINSSAAMPGAMPIIPQPVGPGPAEMTCPHCRCRIRTRISHRSTAKTHIACLLMSWTLCCCCLPYCMDSCRNTNHFCPMCGAFIGTYAS